VSPVTLGDLTIGGGSRFVLIAGPCVIESEQHATDLAGRLVDIARRTQTPFIFKASYDKANRTSGKSFRGPGLDEGLRVLAEVKARHGIPVLTDVHEPADARAAADVVDVLQIPAFLCRQTDLLVAAAQTGRIVNIKKGQFLAPDDVKHAIAKVVDAGNSRVVITERGTSFGYHTLIVDYTGFPTLRATGQPLVFDATHAVQQPGGRGTISGGDRSKVPYLARAAVACGVDGLFMEVHEDPDDAPSDGPNMIPLSGLHDLLVQLLRIQEAVRRPA